MPALITMGKVALAVSVTAYVGICSVLYLSQSRLIFPGAFMPPPPRLAAEVLPAGFQSASVISENGTVLFALHRAPEPGRPVILVFHGNASYPEDYAFLYRLWATEGYGIVAPVARGYPRSQGHPDGQAMLADALSVRDWIEASYPGHPVVAFGQSLGTAPAVHVAAHRTTAGLVLVSPFLSMTSLVAGKLPWIPVTILLASPFRSDRTIGSVRAPIIVFHGDRDVTIPIEQGKALAALAASELTFVTVAGATHNEGLFRPDMNERIRQFLSATTP